MSDNSKRIETLLEEYEVQRNELKSMVKDLEELHASIDRLFPQKLDSRYNHLFQEKVKATTEFFKAILDMRKEILKTVKDEVEMRRKLDLGEEDTDVANSVDIAGIAKKVKKFQDKSDALQKKAQGE